MDSARWQQIWDLFHAALERPGAERSDWLRAQAGADDALVAEVDSLLVAHAKGTTPLDHPPPAPQAEPEIVAGQEIGPWRVVRELGRGGMGRVFEVERADGNFQQRAALKLMAPGLAHPAFVGRFRRERQIMAGLEHPHIARLLDGGSTPDGLPWLAMEYVDGAPIDRWCARHLVALPDRLRLVADVCDAVDYAHGHLVVHRDIKPSNVLVTAGGEPRLLDFGIARLIDPETGGAQTEVHGLRLMTPRYASPEQLSGGAIGVASDVYSLGVLLYELIAGVPPYALHGLSPEGAAERIRSRDPPPLRHAASTGLGRLPSELDWIARKALKADPSERYRSAAALADDLRALLAHRPVAARPDSTGYRLRKFVRRRWQWVAVAAAFAAVVGTLGVRLALESARTRAALAQTEIERDRAERTAGFLAQLFASADPTQAGGREIGAREILDRGRAQLARRDDLPPVVRVTLLGALADVYRNLGAYDASVELLHEARMLVAALDAPVLEADTLQSLGQTLELRGDHQAARAELERALALRRAQGDALGIADADEQLGVTLQSLGERDAALPLFQEAQAIREARLPDDDGRRADAAQRMGSWYWVAGKLDEAEVWYRYALDARRAADPPDLPALSRAIDAYGTLEHARGRYPEAIALLQEAVALRRRVLGDAHRLTAATLTNLGAAWFDSGDDARAEPALREALAIYARALPPDSVVPAKTLNNLGLVRHRQDDPVEARALFERALELNRAAYGPAHANVAGNLNNLGLLYEDTDDLAAAEGVYREAATIIETAMGADHPQLAYVLTNLARVLHWRGDLEAARERFERALAIRRAKLPAGHPALAETLTWFGYTQCASGQDPDGVAMLREALAIREREVGTDEPPTVESRTMLGVCLMQRGDRSEGERLYRASRDALAAERGADDRLVTTLAKTAAL